MRLFFRLHARVPLHGGIIQRNLSKVSGPLLDRIDLHIEVPAVAYQELRGKDQGTGSAEMRQRVESARAIQHQRGFYNSRIPARQWRKLCGLDEAGERTLEMAVRRMGLTPARTTGFLRSRAPSRICRARSRSARGIWRRRCSTGVWIAVIGVDWSQTPDNIVDNRAACPGICGSVWKWRCFESEAIHVHKGP